MITILDCYTDEPAGLGVPPYLGVYPRYLQGYLRSKGASQINYITIDDLRLAKKHRGKILVPSPKQKTNISTHNLTINHNDVEDILNCTKELYIIIGIHTPGKYLSATPGSLKEIDPMLKEYRFKKILCGPIACGGTQMFGGKKIENIPPGYQMLDINFSYKEIAKYAKTSSEIINQIPDIKIIEIETSRGCSREKGCSFCTEPLKNRLEFREKDSILKEIDSFYKRGCFYFRLGKQSCIYAYPGIIELLKQIRDSFPKIKLLHIDNVNPVNVVKDEQENNSLITKAIVKYCSPGNIAAFGIESFDKEVIRANNLNTTPQIALKAIEIINRYGSKKAENGMHAFLPGINILFGLIGETKKTHQENIRYLEEIKERFLIRRINIREVIPYEGTLLEKEVGNKIIKKHKNLYWKWRNDIRQNIDLPMLKKLFPVDAIIKDMYAEIYDGNTTFLRQFATYPIIVGVKQRLPLKQFYNIKITSHMLRSLTGKAI
jgi:radical SAM superfamily enzyme with C-terminal helix-hairpin-helix motif